MDIATFVTWLSEAQARHHIYEPGAPAHSWQTWYAAYLWSRALRETPEKADKFARWYVESSL